MGNKTTKRSYFTTPRSLFRPDKKNNEAQVSNKDNKTQVSNKDNETQVSNKDNETQVSNKDNETQVSNEDNETQVSNKDNETQVSDEDNEEKINDWTPSELEEVFDKLIEVSCSPPDELTGNERNILRTICDEYDQDKREIKNPSYFISAIIQILKRLDDVPNHPLSKKFIPTKSNSIKKIAQDNSKKSYDYLFELLLVYIINTVLYPWAKARVGKYYSLYQRLSEKEELFEKSKLFIFTKFAKEEERKKIYEYEPTRAQFEKYVRKKLNLENEINKNEPFGDMGNIACLLKVPYFQHMQAFLYNEINVTPQQNNDQVKQNVGELNKERSQKFLLQFLILYCLKEFDKNINDKINKIDKELDKKREKFKNAFNYIIDEKEKKFRDNFQASKQEDEQLREHFKILNAILRQVDNYLNNFKNDENKFKYFLTQNLNIPGQFYPTFKSNLENISVRNQEGKRSRILFKQKIDEIIRNYRSWESQYKGWRSSDLELELDGQESNQSEEQEKNKYKGHEKNKYKGGEEGIVSKEAKSFINKVVPTVIENPIFKQQPLFKSILYIKAVITSSETSIGNLLNQGQVKISRSLISQRQNKQEYVIPFLKNVNFQALLKEIKDQSLAKLELEENNSLRVLRKDDIRRIRKKIEHITQLNNEGNINLFNIKISYKSGNRDELEDTINGFVNIITKKFYKDIVDIIRNKGIISSSPQDTKDLLKTKYSFCNYNEGNLESFNPDLLKKFKKIDDSPEFKSILEILILHKDRVSKYNDPQKRKYKNLTEIKDIKTLPKVIDIPKNENNRDQKIKNIQDVKNMIKQLIIKQLAANINLTYEELQERIQNIDKDKLTKNLDIAVDIVLLIYFHY